MTKIKSLLFLHIFRLLLKGCALFGRSPIYPYKKMMKFRQLVLLAVAAIVSIGFTSCSDDDKETSQSPSSAIAGTYTGTVSGESILAGNNETLVISENEDGTVKIVQPGFYTNEYGNGNYHFSGAVVNDVQVEKSEDGYTFYKKYVSSNGGMGVNGEIWGTVKGNQITFDYTYYHAGLLPDPLIHFIGTKK